MEGNGCLQLVPRGSDGSHRASWLQPLPDGEAPPGFVRGTATLAIRAECVKRSIPLGRELTVHPDGDAIGMWGPNPAAASAPELIFSLDLTACEPLAIIFRLWKRGKISWSACTEKAAAADLKEEKGQRKQSLHLRIWIHLSAELFTSSNSSISGDLRTVLDHCDVPVARNTAEQRHRERLDAATGELLGCASDAAAARRSTCLIHGCTLHSANSRQLRDKFRLAEILKSLAAPEDASATRLLASATPFPSATDRSGRPGLGVCPSIALRSSLGLSQPSMRLLLNGRTCTCKCS